MTVVATPTRVLVVEDSDLVRLRLRALLSEIPEVAILAEAATAEEAVRLLPDWEADVMILDLHLPDSSGLGVLRAAKALPRPPRVIVLTDFGYDMLRQRCLAEGADRFLEKSSEFHLLPDVLDELRRAG